MNIITMSDPEDIEVANSVEAVQDGASTSN
jgi:hypothetical protein